MDQRTPVFGSRRSAEQLLTVDKTQAAGILRKYSYSWICKSQGKDAALVTGRRDAGLDEEWQFK